MTNDITTTAAQLPKGFGRTPKYKTAQQLVERLTHIDELQEACNAACDYQRGKEIAAAKESLPHGEFIKALNVKGLSQQKASELRRWYEQITEIPCFETVKAEQKMSQGARVEFCRASDTTKDAVVQKINDPAVTKITAAEIKNSDDSQSSTTHLSPGKSDESPFIECNSYSNDTILDVTPLQQRSGPVSFSEEVRSTQPEMDTDCPQQDDELVSMDTEAIRQRNADFAELERLVRCIEDIHARNLTTDGSGLHQRQWRDLSQQYKSLKYTADVRWQRLRAEMDREHEAFERQLGDACRTLGSKSVG